MSKILDMLNSLRHDGPGMANDFPESAARRAHLSSALSAGKSFVTYYNLQANPFADAINLDCYFRTDSQMKACRQMFSTAEDGISLGLLTGPSGSGKTIVSQMLLEGLDPHRYKTILVLVTPKMTRTVLLEEIVRELDADQPPSRSRELLSLLNRMVIDLHWQGRRLVILIDEAHFLSSGALHMLRTISNLEVPGTKLVTCLLFAESMFRKRLKHHSYRSLSNRMYHKARLAPMSMEETVQYINFRLMAAGGSEALMDKETYGAVYAGSAGIHREVNRLCYLAFSEGSFREQPVITADMVEGT